MVGELSVGTVIEKNKVYSVNPFINLLEIDVINQKTHEYIETVYLANNKEDITYQGKTYVASAFGLDVKKESGGVPSLTCSFIDATGAVEALAQKYEGCTGFPVRVIFVNTGDLTQPPELKEEFVIKYTSNAGYNISVTLGAENPLTKRVPKRKCYRNICTWIYKSEECGYKGDLSTCDFTLTGKNGCRFHNNSKRYGGFPGMVK